MLYWKTTWTVDLYGQLVGKCNRKRSQPRERWLDGGKPGDARSCRGGQWHSEGEDVAGKMFGIVLGSFDCMWGFPKIMVPPNHPILIGFSIINHPFWGILIFGNTHVFCGFFVQVVGWSFRKFFETWKDWQKAADALFLGGMFCSYKKPFPCECGSIKDKNVKCKNHIPMT